MNPSMQFFVFTPKRLTPYSSSHPKCLFHSACPQVRNAARSTIRANSHHESMRFGMAIPHNCRHPPRMG